MTVTRRRIVILMLALLLATGAVFLGNATTPNEAEAAKAGDVV
jgi:hypothetical protein